MVTFDSAPKSVHKMTYIIKIQLSAYRYIYIIFDHLEVLLLFFKYLTNEGWNKRTVRHIACLNCSNV